MKMKSVMAGEYTAPPAHGPIIIEILCDVIQREGEEREECEQREMKAN